MLQSEIALTPDKLWGTIGTLKDKVSATWGTEFRTHWATCLVKEYSYLIWNAVFKKVQKDKGNEHAAHKEAEARQADFLSKWK